MKKVVFESVCGRIMQRLHCDDQVPDFSVICMLSECRSSSVNNLFWEYLGMSGEEVIREIYAGR